MNDLTLGLAIAGALAVAGVLIYNRLQERRARRQAEQAFASTHGDALMDGRREPRFAAARAPAANAAAPDPRVDYIVSLELPPSAEGLLGEAWQPVAKRFSQRALLFRERPGACAAALQLVSRAGVVPEPELIEFRSAVESLAASLGGRARAPGMREALQAARELDGACAEVDIQVALHVVGVAPQQDFAGQPFQAAPREDGVTLTLDVARTADPERSYDAMARAGQALARAQGGRLVDDEGRELDERALATIRAQLAAVRSVLARRGIEPGSPLALRLFS
ncbi:MAG TPA: cell division protein ZipA C-terminal FtsZ-binding domain-containing protein [Burkholderiales bacterium]